MATEQQRGPQTRSRAETQHADFDAYFASAEFESLVNKAVSTEFTRFISSEEFKNMFTATAKSIITQVVSDVVINEIEEATKPLQHQIDSLKDELNKAQIHINHNKQYSRRCNIRIFGIQEIVWRVNGVIIHSLIRRNKFGEFSHSAKQIRRILSFGETNSAKQIQRILSFGELSHRQILLFGEFSHSAKQIRRIISFGELSHSANSLIRRIISFGETNSANYLIRRIISFGELSHSANSLIR
jgi:hypothetical protein